MLCRDTVESLNARFINTKDRAKLRLITFSEYENHRVLSDLSDSQLDNSIYRQKGSFSIERNAEDTESLIKQLGLKDREKSMLHYIFYGLDAAEPKRLKASARDLQKYRLPDALKGIKTPCLLVGSRLDRMHLSTVVKDLSERIPLSEYMETGASYETHIKMMSQKILDYFKRYE